MQSYKIFLKPPKLSATFLHLSPPPISSDQERGGDVRQVSGGCRAAELERSESVAESVFLARSGARTRVAACRSPTPANRILLLLLFLKGVLRCVSFGVSFSVSLGVS